MDFDFHEDKLLHENGCADLQADVHNEYENNFCVDVEHADEEVEVDVGLESVKELIAVGLRVIVLVELDGVADWMHVGERWSNKIKLN